MSVYVGPLFATKQSRKYPYKHAAHLFSDNLDELHLLAGFIGLKPSWFQKGSRPHYDVTQSMRTAAIRAGAIQLPDRRAEGRLLRKLREEEKLICET